MPTIIERIAAAEADAEALRRNAQESARNNETAAEDEAATSLKIAREEAKAGLALAAAMAEKEASAEAERLLTASDEQTEKTVAEASKKLGEAADAIVGYVLKEI